MIEIAQRAGLTKSTFFRHFPDKREVRFGADTMTRLLVEGIAGVPATATPLEAVAHALHAVGSEAFTPARREFSARRRAVIAANPELQEREALKGLGLTTSMTDALKHRGVPNLTSCVAAELGALALKIAYERWSDPTNDDDFSDLAQQNTRRIANSEHPMLTRTTSTSRGRHPSVPRALSCPQSSRPSNVSMPGPPRRQTH